MKWINLLCVLALVANVLFLHNKSSNLSRDIKDLEDASLNRLVDMRSIGLNELSEQDPYILLYMHPVPSDDPDPYRMSVYFPVYSKLADAQLSSWEYQMEKNEDNI